MHSKIYQMSPEPIFEDDFINEDYFDDHYFIGSVADYVVDSDRNEDVSLLKSCAKGFSVDCDEHGYYMVITNREEYFADSFERFRTVLDKIRDCSLEEFSRGVSEMWNLEDSYEDKFSFYVFTDDEDTISLDSFVRRAELNKKFYIGATLGYHF